MAPKAIRAEAEFFERCEVGGSFFELTGAGEDGAAHENTVAHFVVDGEFGTACGSLDALFVDGIAGELVKFGKEKVSREVAGAHVGEAVLFAVYKGLYEALDVGKCVEAEASEQGGGLDIDNLGETLAVDFGQLAGEGFCL